jgi:DNA-binding XRE family transcriptional regulator
MSKRLDTSYHKRMMSARMGDPEFRTEYERARREIDQVDSVIRQLDDLREAAGLSKAELARRIGRDPSSIRRLFSAASNPELLLVASIAEELGAEVRAVPRTTRRPRRSSPGPMANHLTPDELAKELGIDRQEVIRVCVEEGVPIYQGKIDKKLFQAQLQAREAKPQHASTT